MIVIQLSISNVETRNNVKNMPCVAVGVLITGVS